MALAAHKIALQPTEAQVVFFRKSCGVQRFAYNWGLARWKEMYAADKASGIKPTNYSSRLQKELDATKREKWPWMMETCKGVPQGGLQNLKRAFDRFWGGSRYPKFKSKGRARDSFRADGNTTPERKTHWSGRYLKIPKIGSMIRCAERLRFTGKLQRVTIVREADRWFAVFVTATPDITPIVRENQATVGIDLGLTSFAVTSDGERFVAPKPLAKAQKRLAHAQRAVSRRVKGSGRRERAKAVVARLHARVKNVRQDFLHKTSISIVRRYSTIVIEDLNVVGMVQNRKLAHAIGDVGWGEFRRQLTYKCAWYGSRLVVADRFYPSSKTCSACGAVVDVLPLSVREWACLECGVVHDRDENAAMNLASLALLADREDVKRVERSASAPRRKTKVQVGSVKREVSSAAAQSAVGGY